MCSNKSSIEKTLKPLIIECQILVILAPCSKITLYKLYAVIIQSILIFGFITSVCGKQSFLFDSYLSTVKTIDQIANVFLTLASVTTSLLTVFLYPNKLHKLFQDIGMFDKILGKCSKKQTNLFWLSFLFIQVMALLTISLDSWVWTSGLGYEMYKYYVVRDIQYYQVNVMVLFIFWFAMEIYYRYKLLNELLMKCIEELCQEGLYFSSINLNRMERKINYKNLKHISKLQNFLFDITNAFNGIFGIMILFTVLFYIMYMVQYTAELIFYTIIDNQINGVSFGASLSIVSAVWIIECFVSL